jgi:predicted outer membrane lipoprotein
MGTKIKKLLDEFHYHEAMDRTAMLTDMVDSYLVQHPVFKAEKEFAEKIEQAGTLLAEAYQIVGNLYFERSENIKTNNERTESE